jgi:1-acyl-sn-glycerol-3-phosphate acyltransferase
MAKDNIVRAALLGILDIIVTAFFAAMAIILPLISTRGEKTSYLLAHIWGKILIRISGVTVEVIGAENVPRNRPLIFMANHQSNFDILALLGFIPVQFYWISKKEVFYVPLLGAAMKRAGYISIDRQDRAKAIQSLEEAARIIRNGKSVMTFPEGTRSRGGEIRPFKKGPFYLALQSKVPIIPVSIIGSRAILPRRSLRMHPGKITMIIDKPIDTTEYSHENRDELMSKVFEVITRNFGIENLQSKGKAPR